METDARNILIVVGLRVPERQLQRVIAVLQDYFEAHRDHFSQNIQLRAAAPETYNVYLPLRCSVGQDSASWSKDFTSYLTDHDVDWSGG